MLDLQQIQRSFSHDPSRRDDRSPFGAVVAGTVVKLVLRVADDVRNDVREVWLEVEEDSQLGDAHGRRTVPMQPCKQGFVGYLDTSGDPRVVFYRFRISADSGEVLCANRQDDLSTSGDARPLSSYPTEESTPRGFQLTVYDSAFTAPSWFSGGVMYQVFPDRFAIGSSGVREEGIQAHEKRGWPVAMHEDWDEPPAWGASYDPIDFFGGTLEGIREKLDYLESLGVATLYLNPIVEARSNHRYNTGDYEQIDPILGDWNEFDKLRRAADERGIRIMLDTVLSHTGSSSKYFNLDGSYDTVGAAQSENSPYRSWYDFATYADSIPPYRAWWGDATLPEVEEHAESWQKYVLGDGGVIQQWLSHGVCGLRLDVADELPDDVIEKIRQTAKDASPHTVILGEVWEDPTIKESYGRRRTYALGRALDSVMNYPLREALIQFALGGKSTQQLTSFLKTQRINYPRPLYGSLMNLLSSHDVERVRSVLAVGRGFRHLERDDQEKLVLEIDEAADAEGSKLQEMLAAMLYTLPGVPCLYYGDERGMHGGRDPFDRATFPWNSNRADCGIDLTQSYMALGQLRANSPSLQSGESAFYSHGKDISCILRVGADGAYICIANRSKTPQQFGIDLLEASSGLSREAERALRYANGALDCVFSTGGHHYAEYLDGIVTGQADAQQATIFHMDCEYRPETASIEEAPAVSLRGLLGKPLDAGRGIICHVTSIPGGTLGEAAKKFVDELADAGVTYWQILPLNPTDEYGSPYAGLSAFAGNTLLLAGDTSADGETAGDDKAAVAADTADVGDAADTHDIDAAALNDYVEANSKWLIPYATFAAIKRTLGEIPWQKWPEEYREWRPELAELPALAETVQNEVLKQYEFERQWQEVRRHANERGVFIVGDMPIYVSADSSDVWAHRDIFMLDENGHASEQGGVPPDAFAAEGQLWGNPTYNWKRLREDGYVWWIERLRRMFDLYDYVRIDHFLGFNSYYAIPAGKTAADGKWVPGPGLEFFQKAYEELGPLPVIAEDLGIITDEVNKLIADTGFPGMDVIQFSDGDPRMHWSPKPSKIAYTGTHDTQTLLGWVKERYGLDGADALDEMRRLVRTVIDSDAKVAMVPLQDVLELDNSARMNVPGTAGQNWKWQALQADIDAKLPRLRLK